MHLVILQMTVLLAGFPGDWGRNVTAQLVTVMLHN